MICKSTEEADAEDRLRTLQVGRMRMLLLQFHFFSQWANQKNILPTFTLINAIISASQVAKLNILLPKACPSMLAFNSIYHQTLCPSQAWALKRTRQQTMSPKKSWQIICQGLLGIGFW